MKRKTAAIAVLLMVVCVATLYGRTSEGGTINPFLRVWRKIDASNVSFNLNTYGQVNEVYSSKGQLANLLTDVAKSFDEEVTDYDYYEQEEYRECRVDISSDSDVYVSIIVQSLDSYEEVQAETSLVVNVDSSNLDLLMEYKQKLEGYLNEIACSAPVNCTIMGTVENLSSTREISNLLALILYELYADTKDLYADKNVISLSALTPDLPDNPYGWDFNLQIAIREGPSEGLHTIWMGWPALGHPY